MVTLEEQLIPLRDVPAFLESRGIRSRFGRRVSKRSVNELVQRGLLETTKERLFGSRYTSVEAIERWMARGQPTRKDKETPTPKRERKRREKQAASSAAADAELDAVGW